MGQAGPQGQDAFPGQPGYPPLAGGFHGPDGQQAPYPEYQAWPPQGVPGGYPGPAGYGESVNVGDYAYVIREDVPPAPQAPRPPAWERGQGLGEWSREDAGAAPDRPGANMPAAEVGVRAITAGADTRWPPSSDGPPETPAPGAGPVAAPGANSAAGHAANPGAASAANSGAGHAANPGAAPAANPGAGPATQARARARAQAAADVDPALAYGPDDPAYGPPGPDWYNRDEERPQRTGDGEPPPEAGEQRSARGPFEPLAPAERDTTDFPLYEPADGEADHDGDDAEEPEVAEPLDFGTPSDPEAGALGQVRDLYLTAESISPASLEINFDQLLERQRELITDYFEESGGLILVEAPTPIVPADPASQAETPASATPLGFDGAASLAGLLGELRSAP
jgi:hypothetical protein